MRLYGNGALLGDIAEEIALEKSRGDAAATLSVTLCAAAADNYLKKESLKTGDALLLTDDADAEIFRGAVQAVTRSAERVVLVGCDAGLYLTANELYGVFAGSSEDICRAVAGKLGIPVGTLDVPAGYRALTFRAGARAFDILRLAVGEEREISVRDGKLCVEAAGETVLSPAEDAVYGASGSADVRRMVNKCVVVGRKGGVLASAQNAADIAAHGQRQKVLGKSGDAAVQAQNALVGRVMRGSLVLRGDLKYRCGVKIALARPDWGIDGAYPIVAVKHVWKAGVFTSEVTWEASK